MAALRRGTAVAPRGVPPPWSVTTAAPSSVVVAVAVAMVAVVVGRVWRKAERHRCGGPWTVRAVGSAELPLDLGEFLLQAVQPWPGRAAPGPLGAYRTAVPVRTSVTVPVRTVVR